MRAVIPVLFLLIAATSAAEPRDEIGVVRISTYTPMRILGDADGWGLSFRHDFSTRLSIQAHWSGVSHSVSEFVSVPADSSRSLINLRTELNLLTAGLAYDLVDDGDMALSVGIGGGLALFEQTMFPGPGGCFSNVDDARSVVEADISCMVRQLGDTPFGLRLSFRSRRIYRAVGDNDIYGDISNAFTVSNLEAGLIWRF